MRRISNLEELGDALAAFRINPDWEKECTLGNETLTPGVFYHGSPDVNIRDFRSQFHQPGLEQTEGVFFTENPTYAAGYTARRGNTLGGRIYKVELATRNPYFVDPAIWIERVTNTSREVERDECAKAKSDGFDSIVSLSNEGTIFEIIVLDDQVIRRRDREVGLLTEWRSAKAVDALVFYRFDDLAAPCFASDGTPLFAKRENPTGYSGRSHRVVVDAHNPIYCCQTVWPNMNFDILNGVGIDLLVDPFDGSALALNQEHIQPINRQGIRSLRARHRNMTKVPA